MSYPADPHWANVKVLNHFEGVNGGSRIYDETNAAVTVPVLGTTLSGLKSKFGNTSFLAGTDRNYYLSYSNIGATYGTADFTAEAWLYPKETASTLCWTFGELRSTWAVLTKSTFYPTKFSVNIGNASSGSAPNMVSASDVVYEAWTHVALTRTGTTFTLFINGVAEATYSNSVSLDSSRFYVGWPSGTFNGYVDEVRVTIGVNRYPTNFTPPTAAFPHSGVVDPYYDKVQAHLHFNGENGAGTFTDQKGHAFNMQPGTAGQIPVIAVSSSAKFGMSWGEFTSDSKGITATSSDFILGASDFTIEFYAYARDYDAYPNMSLFHAVSSDGTTDAIHVTQTPYSGELKVFIAGTQVIAASGAGIGALNHIALVRQGGFLRLYANGNQIGTAYNIGATSIPGNGVIGIGRTQFGRMDEFRLTVGVARYLSNFTVPTEPFPDIGPNFLSGTVLDSNNTPLARTVRAFRRSDSLLTDATVSDASTGAFELRATDMSEHYVLVFDDVRNAMIYDHIEPVV